MARRVFFSFHYAPDVQRAQVVRNSWVTKADRQEAGFFDSSVFESKKRTSDNALKGFLAAGLSNCSVTAVLYGSGTAYRRWVRYEVLKSFADGKGMLAIDVHSIKNFEKQTAAAGVDPLSCLGFEVSGPTCKFKERRADGQWVWATDIVSAPVNSLKHVLRGATNSTLDSLCGTYDWSTNAGYANLGSWVETAAARAGR